MLAGRSIVKPSLGHKLAAALGRAGLAGVSPLAYRWLAAQANAGQAAAAALLASAYTPAQKAGWKRWIATIRHPASIDALWAVWFLERAAPLAEALGEIGFIARAPVAVRAASLVQLNRVKDIASASPEVVLALYRLRHGPDPHFSQRAWAALSLVRGQNSINALCAEWAAEGDAQLDALILEKSWLPTEPPDLLVRLSFKLRRFDWLSKAGPAEVDALLAALTGPAAAAADMAEFCLRNLKQQSAVNRLCEAAENTRQPRLAVIVRETSALPSPDHPAFAWCALVNRRLETFEQLKPVQVSRLLPLLNDPSPELQSVARAALPYLAHNPPARAELTRLWLDEENPSARDAALQAQLLPEAPAERALFLFLAGQLDDYAILDFDRKLLRAAYASAPAPLRARIRRAVQSSRRVDFLPILSGVDSGQVGLTPDEITIQRQLLLAERHFERIWQLLNASTLHEAANTLAALRQAGWLPADSADQEFNQQALALLDAAPLQPLASLLADAPEAVQTAVLRVSGRVNSIDFSPSHTILAIGTGQKKVILWDLNRGQLLRRLPDFAHSIAEVRFDEDGSLWVSERTNQSAPCGVYHVRPDGQVRAIGSHNGTVTLLLPLPGERLLSGGRDQHLHLWDTSTGRPLHSVKLRVGWPRFGVEYADHQEIIIFTPAPEFYSAANLDRLPHTLAGDIHKHSAPRCALALADGGFLVGANDGSVQYLPSRQDPAWRELARHPQATQDLGFVSGQLPFSTAANGEVYFYNQALVPLKHSLRTPANPITVARASADGKVLAIGSHSTFWLYAICGDALRQALNTPILRLSLSEVAWLESLLPTHSLPEPLQNAVKFLALLVRHQYRYDIQIDDIATLQAGEFDIEIDG